jgi:hypothetical protein
MNNGLFLIKNTGFNREHYPTMIGMRFAEPPAYAQGAWERDDLEKMSDSELVSWWNILQMGRRMIQVGDAKELGERHIAMLQEIFADRHIPHEDGKLIETVRVMMAA